MARVTSQLSGPSAGDGPEALAAGNIVVDVASYRVTVDDAPVVLTYQEFELLRLLITQPDRIMPYELLARALWSSTGQKKVRRLGVVVCRLRAKLAASWPYRIETVRGRGYGLATRAEHR